MALPAALQSTDEEGRGVVSVQEYSPIRRLRFTVVIDIRCRPE